MNEVQSSLQSGIVPASVIQPNYSEIGKMQWIPHLSSLTVISATAAYLIGFIVVNSHLFKYGMVPYDFLQPRYVSAGLLYLAGTVGFTSILFLLIHLVKQKHFQADQINAEIKSAWLIYMVFVLSGFTLGWLLPKSESINWWLEQLRIPSLALAFAFMILGTTGMPIPNRFSRFDLWWKKHVWEAGRLSWIVLLLMIVNSLSKLGDAYLFYPLFLCGVWFFSSGFRPNQRQESVVSENMNGLIWGTSNLCLSIFMYGTFTYPLISPHLGGGKPLLVSLSIKSDHRGTIGRVMGRDDWKCVMHNISLIHENSELIYILPKGYLAEEAAIAIPKSELVSIAYQRKSNPEHATCLE